MSIVTAVAVVTVIGLLGAAILVVAAHFMHVEEDPRVGEVLGVLPGAAATPAVPTMQKPLSRARR